MKGTEETTLWTTSSLLTRQWSRTRVKQRAWKIARTFPKVDAEYQLEMTDLSDVTKTSSWRNFDQEDGIPTTALFAYLFVENEKGLKVLQECRLLACAMKCVLNVITPCPILELNWLYSRYRVSKYNQAVSRAMDGTAVPSWSCLQAVTKPVWHVPLLCVQWKTTDDGQRNCPKHVEFYSKNKFEKLVHLGGFIIRI